MPILRFISIVIILSLILFAYPVWRLGDWLQFPPLLHLLSTLLLFSSQFIVRIGLRNRTGRLIYLLRGSGDFFLGLSPVLLGLVLLGEAILLITDIPELTVGLMVCGTTVLAATWGVWAAWRPRVVTVPLTSHKLTRPARFVQISDVHIGSRTERFLRQTLQQVEALNPDFLCITGDFIDQPDITVDKLKSLAEFKRPIYFSTGNHERYEDHDQIMERLTSLGVTVLRNEAVMVDGLQIIGIDDGDDPEQVAKVLPSIEVRNDCYSILLYHRPQGIEAAEAQGVDLKISGHTHNGQIFPFSYAVKTRFEYLKGLHPYKSAYLYVNEGTGTWGPTLRIGTRSEVTLFELSPETIRV